LYEILAYISDDVHEVRHKVFLHIDRRHSFVDKLLADIHEEVPNAAAGLGIWKYASTGTCLCCIAYSDMHLGYKINVVNGNGTIL
jgi:hypothetical protein